MIHSARPTVSLVANIVLAWICFVLMYVRTDDMIKNNDHYRMWLWVDLEGSIKTVLSINIATFLFYFPLGLISKLTIIEICHRRAGRIESESFRLSAKKGEQRGKEVFFIILSFLIHLAGHMDQPVRVVIMKFRQSFPTIKTKEILIY